MVCTSQVSSHSRRIFSPAPPSNNTLSGSTTAALPVVFNMLTMCCRKFSCLLLVEVEKSWRS